MNHQIKIGYFWHNRPEATREHEGRAETIRRALTLAWPPGYEFDFQVIGPASLKAKADKPYQVSEEVAALGLDLLLIDCFAGQLVPLLTDHFKGRGQPSQTWLISRHWPKAYIDIASMAQGHYLPDGKLLDRIYHLEPFLAGQGWLFERRERELLPPIVECLPGQLLDRYEARAQLLKLWQAQNAGAAVGGQHNLPIVLMLSTGTEDEGQRRAFEEFTKATLYKALGGPENYRPVLMRGDNSFGEASHAWACLKGCDAVIATADYQNFWNVSFLVQNGHLPNLVNEASGRPSATFFNLPSKAGEAAGLRLMDDQKWRADNQTALLDYYPREVKGYSGQNGADVLALEIVREFTGISFSSAQGEANK